MDPNANIAEQVQHARNVIQALNCEEFVPPAGYDRDAVVEHGIKLAELVIALDEWRSKGGFAPADDCRADPLVAPCATCGAEAYYVHDNQPSCGAHAAPDALLAIHQMLFPERYPRAVQPDHVFWDDHEESECVSTPEMGAAVFEWNSGTIEVVAEMLERALSDDPRAKLKPR